MAPSNRRIMYLLNRVRLIVSCLAVIPAEDGPYEHD